MGGPGCDDWEPWMEKLETMSTSKKDYEAIAKAIREVELSLHPFTELRRMSTKIADHFEKDNPNFDREKFLEACNVL